MPGRIPTPGVSTPAVRASKTAQPAAKPVENAASRNAAKSEAMLKQKIATGKVTDLNATRQQIAKKTGSWPNGYTN